MKLKNDTNLPNVLVRELIRSVRPPGIEIKEVKIVNAGKHSSGSGRAYTGRGRIKVRLPRQNNPQCRAIWKPRKAYLGMAIGNRIELLIMLLAHELRHLWQGQGKGYNGPFRVEKPKPRKGMVWGSKGRFSERDADAYALHKIRQYRRGEL